MKYSNTLNTPIKQQGAVLIIGLILLFSLTLLGIGAMNTNLMQQRMATNMGDATLAFNAADSILRQEQMWLLTQADEKVLSHQADCGNAVQCIYYKEGDGGSDLVDFWYESLTFDWNTQAYKQTPSVNDNVKTDPKMIIEKIQFELDTLEVGTSSNPPGTTYYRFTARGTGSTDLSEAVLQSTVSKRWN